MTSFNQPDPAVGGQLCNRLGDILQHGIDIHRCLAAQGLGRIGSQQPAAAEVLIGALQDEDEDVRSDAASALARFAPPESGAQLLQNLIFDPCAEVKSAAIDALVRMRHPETAPWLRRLVKGRHPDVVWDEDELYSGGWDDSTDIQLHALAGLSELGVTQAVPDITEAIDDEFGQDLQQAGFAALARLGDAGIAALDDYFSRGDARMRRRVAGALGAADAGGAIMDRALEDGEAEVRLAAVRAIAAHDPADKRLESRFLDASPEIRAEIIALSGACHPDQAIAALGDKSPEVQLAGLKLLAQMPDIPTPSGFLGDLASMLHAADENIAALAANACAAIAPGDSLGELCALVGDTDRHITARAGAATALGRIGGEAAEGALIAVIGDSNRTLRLAAMTALLAIAGARKFWPCAAGEALLAALRGELAAVPPPPPPEPAPDADADADGGENADREESDTAPEDAFPNSTLAAILGDQAPPPAADEATGAPVELTQADIDLLAQTERMPRKISIPVTPKVAPYEDLRRIAARFLGDVPHIDVAWALVEALDDGDAEVRAQSADSLARIVEDLADQHGGIIPSGITQRLQAALGHPDRDVRLGAVRALGAEGCEGAADMVAGLCAHDDSFTRAEAVRTLGRLKYTGPEIAALLDDPDRNVRSQAAEALAQSRPPRELDHLIEFAFSFGGIHRREAGRLLRGIDAPAASRRFLEVLDDPERIKQWQIAIEALIELNQPQQTTGTGGRIS